MLNCSVLRHVWWSKFTIRIWNQCSCVIKMMRQRAAIRFSVLKWLKAREIQAELEPVYGPEVLAFSTVKQWRKRFQKGSTDLIDDPKRERPMTQDFAQAIQSMLTERSFMSCKVTCRHLHIGTATYLRIFHNDLWLIKFHLRCLPHTLRAAQKSERLSYSKLLSGHTWTTAANWLWIYDNRRWVLALFMGSSRRSVGTIQR
jgi:transposase